jgi:hypothetical protein
MMTREQMLDRDEPVLRAKVTMTKDQLANILHTFYEGAWDTNWDELPDGTIAFWLPLAQVGVEYAVVRSDCQPAIALEQAPYGGKCETLLFAPSML